PFGFYQRIECSAHRIPPEVKRCCLLFDRNRTQVAVVLDRGQNRQSELFLYIALVPQGPVEVFEAERCSHGYSRGTNQSRHQKQHKAPTRSRQGNTRLLQDIGVAELALV